jgi:DNA recombination protein RmuC
LEVTEDLADRIDTFIGHVEGIGKGLRSSINSYNKTVGSYNRRLLPAQEKLNELKGSNENFLEMKDIEDSPREIQEKLKTE